MTTAATTVTASPTAVTTAATATAAASGALRAVDTCLVDKLGIRIVDTE